VPDAWVVNASPLIILSRINRLDFLENLASAALIPAAVIAEVGAGLHRDPSAATAQQWAKKRILPNLTLPTTVAAWGLGAGESQVVVHCLGNARIAVLDDQAGRWIGQRQRKVPLFLGLGILLVCVLSVKGFYGKSALTSDRSVQLHSALIDSLMELRDRTPTDVVIQLDATVPAYNPIARCTAQPFVFPAVSERPWLDVIATRNDCTYQNYGYGSYGITTLQQRVTVPPQILPGMNQLSWPSVTTDLQSSSKYGN